ncbi:MAG: M48 family metallopeptidase [Lachnospiraceae bacterium]|nr:M48 family metallopeptidase [Lachnospiraceae bacterium]
MRNKEVVIGGLPVEISRKSNQKNIYIRVKPPEGNVTVSAPARVPDREIERFVLKKMPEIMKARDKVLARERQNSREYISGETQYLWGRPYPLQVVYGGTRGNVIRTPEKIVMTVPEGTETEAREALLNEWYRGELKQALEGAVLRCENRTGLHAEEYRIKNMKTRWGTCNIQKRRIWINLQLAKKPVECLDYVVIHELVHLLEKNHTRRFYALVEGFCPAWREAEGLLKEAFPDKSPGER